MWIFVQRSGRIYHNGEFVIDGYAGAGAGRNNPDMHTVKNIGPLPVGRYLIGWPHEGTHMGPFALELIPDPKNEMFGRSAFYWHGDNGKGTASEGCICSALGSRQMAHKAADRFIDVVAEDPFLK